MNLIKREAHHLDFAMQLEAMGLWHWAIFVILHLQDPHKRSKLAKEILGRNVLPSDDESSEREVFLQERLGVPTSWIAEAKATRASVDCNYGDQVKKMSFLGKAFRNVHDHPTVRELLLDMAFMTFKR